MRLPVLYFGIITLLVISVMTIVVIVQFDKLDIEKRFREWQELRHAEKDFLDNRMRRRFFAAQHDDYWLLQNYVQADDFFPKNESITITTHGTYKDLSMIEDLIHYWKSPVSVALFANDVDFNRTLNRIFYLRQCSPGRFAIRYFVTFHLVIHKDHMPLYIPKAMRNSHSEIDCTKRRQSFQTNTKESFWAENNLEYPLNLMRNFARQSAVTFYVIPLEMGFIPSEFFMKDFLHMTRNLVLNRYERSVYCMPVMDFESFKAIDHKVTEHYRKHHDQYLGSVVNLRHHFLYISHVTNSSESCRDVYVTINEFQPTFDESMPTECIIANSKEKNLLDVLGYRFVMMRGTTFGRKGTPEYAKVYKDIAPKVNCSSIFENAEIQWKLLYSGVLGEPYDD